MAVARHIGGERANLAIGDLAGRARILARNTTRRLALFQKAGLINDKDSLLISERFQRVIAYNVAQPFRIPPATAQDRLLTPQARIASRFRAHPPGLARIVPSNPSKNCPCRCRHPLLAKQQTKPRLHIP